MAASYAGKENWNKDVEERFRLIDKFMDKLCDVLDEQITTPNKEHYYELLSCSRGREQLKKLLIENKDSLDIPE